MAFLSEKEIEDVFVIHPELIEDHLKFIDRQLQLETRRIDLLFKDSKARFLCIEIKKDEIKIADLYQLSDYMVRFQRSGLSVRGMIIGQFLSTEMITECKKRNLEWRAITHDFVYEYLQKKDPVLFQTIFLDHKIPTQQLEQVRASGFTEYLELNSRYGIPLSSYQFLRPKDKSPKLSYDLHLNMQVADEFIQRIEKLPFQRNLFLGKMKLSRLMDVPIKPVVHTSNGAWTGNILTFRVELLESKKMFLSYLYIGTIGMRGNPISIYADGLSRFLVVRLSETPYTGHSQYGFHKYLCTDEQALLPFLEIPFSRDTNTEQRQQVFDLLERFGYEIREISGSKKHLWIGNIQSNSEYANQQIGNLIEHLFVVSIIKEHVKAKLFQFQFLNGPNTKQ